MGIIIILGGERCLCCRCDGCKKSVSAQQFSINHEARVSHYSGVNKPGSELLKKKSWVNFTVDIEF